MIEGAIELAASEQVEIAKLGLNIEFCGDFVKFDGEIALETIQKLFVGRTGWFIHAADNVGTFYCHGNKQGDCHQQYNLTEWAKDELLGEHSAKDIEAAFLERIADKGEWTY